MASSAGSGSGDSSAEFEGGRDLDRVVFFSDAVFAIAMTVLALTLSLPAGTTDAGVAPRSTKRSLRCFSYALSFGVIAIYWLAHHRMFRYIRRLDATLLVLNLASLGAIAFVPFPTSVLGQHGSTTAAVVFYAATMGVVGGLFSVFWMYATHDRRFIRADTPPRFVNHALWRAMTHSRRLRRLYTDRVRRPTRCEIVLAHDRRRPSRASPPIRQHLRPVKGHMLNCPF